MPLDRAFFIAPPFGSYFSHPHAYSVLGSFTAQPRPGRWRRVLRTVRPVPSDDGPAWINKIGLRNPGIESLPRWKRKDADGVFLPHQIVSLAPLADTDWHAFERWLDERWSSVLVEFNVSCPNVDQHPELPPDATIRRLLAICPDAVWKLPPVERAPHTALHLASLGARYVHLSNTIPSPIGGISGAPLRELNLPLVERVAHSSPELEVVGGGGIYDQADLRRYADAGATRFSLGTAWFWPPRARRLLNHREAIYYAERRVSP